MILDTTSSCSRAGVVAGALSALSLLTSIPASAADAPSAVARDGLGNPVHAASAPCVVADATGSGKVADGCAPAQPAMTFRIIQGLIPQPSVTYETAAPPVAPEARAVPNASVAPVATATRGVVATHALSSVPVASAPVAGQLRFVSLYPFVVGHSSFTPELRTQIDGFVAQLRARNDVGSVEVIAHTDPTGDPTFNLWLSGRRAQVVRDLLVAAGFDAASVTAKGVGAVQPIPNAPNADAQRGVEINASLRRLP